MAVTHSAALRNELADAVLAAIDISSNGLLEFQTSGDVEVATLTFSDPAGVVAAEVLTFSAITDDTNATGGTVAKAEIQTSAGAACVLCAVGTSGSDINLSSLVIGAGDTVSVSALTYTASL